MPARPAILLDANAGAPLHPRVKEALLRLLDEPDLGPLNPSSHHSHGRHARRLIEKARRDVASSFGASEETVLFASSGTEANQAAIRGVLERALAKGPAHWITTPVEHDSVLQMIRWFESRGGAVSLLPVDGNGVPRGDSLAGLLRPGTALVSCIWVNNETGAITDIAPLVREARARDVPVHLDGAQAWGKIRLDLPGSGADFVSFSGHKIGAMPGTGVLWARAPGGLEALFPGKQEKGRRGGTENVMGAVALGVAASALDPDAWAARVAPLRERLEREILDRVPGAVLNAGRARRVANTLSVSFGSVSFDGGGGSGGFVQRLDLEGYCVSAGSACASGSVEPSHVLLAMGRSREQARASLRISLPDELPWEALEGFVSALERIASTSSKGRL